MDAPVQEIKHRIELLDTARQLLEEKKFEEAKATALEAVRLDEFYAQSFTLLAEICENEGNAKEAEGWRACAKSARYEIWKREVEAEARGHHEVFGTPVRHEIP